jgi:hypothetical protein
MLEGALPTLHDIFPHGSLMGKSAELKKDGLPAIFTQGRKEERSNKDKHYLPVHIETIGPTYWNPR